MCHLVKCIVYFTTLQDTVQNPGDLLELELREGMDSPAPLVLIESYNNL